MTAAAGYSSQMALFQMPPINTGIDNVRWVDFTPINQYSNGSVIDFVLHPNPTAYIDLSRCYLHVQAKVSQENGDPLPAVPIGNDIPDECKVGPVNLWLSSLFADMSLYVQQKLISSTNTLYPIKAYIDTILKESYV